MTIQIKELSIKADISDKKENASYQNYQQEVDEGGQQQSSIKKPSFHSNTELKRRRER
ncbi:MAG: hypothetical protein IKP81_07490 [Paludibacteraceae bacterium]|nr:hypothetical protein [Paludibacteraceae bacterium]